MIVLERTVGVLLCSGASRRYGHGNKLLAPYRGRMLVEHAALRLAALPYQCRLAIAPPFSDEPDMHEVLRSHGLRIVVNDKAGESKGIAVALALRSAARLRPDGVLIALGDMPNVEVRHLLKLSWTARYDTAAASSAGGQRTPPVLLPKAIVELALHPGADPLRRLLERVQVVDVAASPDELADFDTPEDFQRLLPTRRQMIV